MPAAAISPAPIACIKVVALKKLVVGFLLRTISRAEEMINMDNCGHSYLSARGEKIGAVKDGLLRKHLPRMFSLTKNES